MWRRRTGTRPARDLRCGTTISFTSPASRSDEVLTLEEIRSAYESMEEHGGYEQDDVEQAKAFVDWCEEYWKEREMPAHYGISVTLSY